MEDIKTKLVADIPEPSKELKYIAKLAREELSKQIAQYIKVEERIILYMLRHQVDPPIKGEITKGKIKWRGLSIARLQKDNTFLGILQRGKFIEPDWLNIQLQGQLEETMMFGISNLRKQREEAIKYYTGGIFEQMSK